MKHERNTPLSDRQCMAQFYVPIYSIYVRSVAGKLRYGSTCPAKFRPSGLFFKGLGDDNDIREVYGDTKLLT